MVKSAAKERREGSVDSTKAVETVGDKPLVETSPVEAPVGAGLFSINRKRATTEDLPDPATAETVGQLLSRTRVRFGQDLKQVAGALRIRLTYLESIEADRHGDLPGLPYAVGFVRSYAEYLGLPGPATVQRFKEEMSGLARRPQLVFPAPAKEGKVPTGAIILVSLILVVGAYLGWTFATRETAPPPELAAGPDVAAPTVVGEAAPAPEATAPAVVAPAPVAAPVAPAPLEATPAPSTAENDSNSLGAPLSAPLEAAASEAPAAPETATPETAVAAIPTVPAREETVAAEAAVATGRIVIRATQDSWLQVRDADDQAIITKVLREGESYEVPDQTGLVLLTGNAGGLLIEVDGVAVPSLGPVGSVRRGVALDPELLKSGTAAAN